MKFTAKQLFTAILLLALFLRLPGFFASLAYDEIWTLLNFAPLSPGEVLFSLELPNNHPLNTLAVKFIHGVFTALPPEFIRLFSLLAGLGSIVLAGLIAQRFGKDKACCWSMFFMAVAAPLIVYSSQARGYSMQIFFLLLYCYGAICSAEAKPQTVKTIAVAILLTSIGALGTVMTVASGAIFLLAVTLLLWGSNDWKKPQYSCIAAVTTAGILSLTYILLNLPELLAARSWGSSTDTFGSYFYWLGDTFFRLLLLGALPLAGYWLWKMPKRRRIAHGIFALTIALSALFTNAGPHRVYLPLTVYWAILGGLGAEKFFGLFNGSKRNLAALLIILLTLLDSMLLAMPFWKISDYYPLHIQSKQLPESALLIYPAADTYPLLFNSSGDAAARYAQSLSQHPAQRLLLIADSPDKIIGSDRAHNQRSLPFLKGRKLSIANYPVMEYQLERLRSALPLNEYIIALIPPQANKSAVEQLEKELLKNIGQEKSLLLNLWLNHALLPDGREFHGGLYLLTPDALNQTTATQLLQSTAGRIVYYRVIPPQQ